MLGDAGAQATRGRQAISSCEADALLGIVGISKTVDLILASRRRPRREAGQHLRWHDCVHVTCKSIKASLNYSDPRSPGQVSRRQKFACERIFNSSANQLVSSGIRKDKQSPIACAVPKEEKQNGKDRNSQPRSIGPTGCDSPAKMAHDGRNRMFSGASARKMASHPDLTTALCDYFLVVMCQSAAHEMPDIRYAWLGRSCCGAFQRHLPHP